MMSPFLEQIHGKSNSPAPDEAASSDELKVEEEEKQSDAAAASDMQLPLENGVTVNGDENCTTQTNLTDHEDAASENAASNEEEEDNSQPKDNKSPPKISSRRTSRSCRPNTLIFTEDMTTNSPHKKKGRPS